MSSPGGFYNFQKNFSKISKNFNLGLVKCLNMLYNSKL